uniref:(California timema) hypothetical protein n=1 Tax=Timema californicum TaxID=61474 RepID=A0A7R9PE77_TIMCA|nr:unnamed protein product [Timema californicum]
MKRAGKPSLLSSSQCIGLSISNQFNNFFKKMSLLKLYGCRPKFVSFFCSIYTKKIILDQNIIRVDTISLIVYTKYAQQILNIGHGHCEIRV